MAGAAGIAAVVQVEYTLSVRATTLQARNGRHTRDCVDAERRHGRQAAGLQQQARAARGRLAPLLEYGHLGADLAQGQRAGEPAHAGADDRDPHGSPLAASRRARLVYGPKYPTQASMPNSSRPRASAMPGYERSIFNCMRPRVVSVARRSSG